MMQFTDAAIAHIQSIFAKNPGKNLFRITVKVTGCTGLMYVPSVEAEPKAGDLKIDAETRIAAYIDSEWQHALEGTTVDYVQHGLGQKQLHFNNPNADSLCGCGESFNLKDKS